MFTAIEAREFIRYTDIKTRELTKTVLSTSLGSRLLLGGMAGFLGLSADQQANWQIDLSPQEQGHTLSLDSHHLSAPKYDPSLQVELPNVQVPVGEYETISRNGVEITRIYPEGENDPDKRKTVLIYLDGAIMQMAKNMVQAYFIPDPMSNNLDKVAFWVRNPQGVDLTCGLPPNRDCYMVLKEETDKVIAATGVIPQGIYQLKKVDNAEVKDSGIGGSFFMVPPTIYNSVLLTWPEQLTADWQRLLVGHYEGHLAGLVDEYPLEDRNWDINMPNCTRTPSNYNWQPTPYKGCSYDKESYRPTATSLMKEYVPYFGEFNGRWIEQTLNPFRNQLPKLELKLLSSIFEMRTHLSAGIPYGTTQYKIEVVPYNNDGPGIQMIYGDSQVIKDFRKNGFEIKAPEIGVGNYILLPDMSYKVRVWVSDAKTGLSWLSPDWERYKPWPHITAPNPPFELNFRTLKADSTTISPANFTNGEQTTDSTPTLEWRNSNPYIFYYEVQLSGDPNFEMNPDKATSFVFWNLIHGGMTNPQNSWTVPDNVALPPGKYYWRARPRIQGDGTPVVWTPNFSFEIVPTLK